MRTCKHKTIYEELGLNSGETSKSRSTSGSTRGASGVHGCLRQERARRSVTLYPA